ncbi:TlpA family protein disulfide reductase [Gelidibacter mesophilus]|uniref:TlpA family protein disulfide reductase n=1 Tax=Gelidibacter mesophilus TaxID=169050 RepID=UPI0004214442|nr:TlpA disulfide reductase family protein [Gelidibacter mesophilus]
MNNLKFKYPILLALIFFVGLGCEDKEASKKEIRNDEIVLVGQVKNIQDTTINFSYYQYKFLEDLVNVPVDFDSAGKFKLQLKVDSPVKGWFSFGKESITEEFTYTTIAGIDTTMKTGTFDFKMVHLFLKPGDSVSINLDARDINSSLTFSGTDDDDIVFAIKEDQAFNDYKHKYLKNWYDVSQREPEDFKQNADKLYEKKMKFLNDFKSSHNLSSSLVSFYETNNYSSLVSAKVSYPGIHELYNKNKELNLPNDYYAFLNNVKIEKSIAENGLGYFFNIQGILKKKYELYTANNPNAKEFYDWLKDELPEKVRYEYMAYSLRSDFSNRIYSEFDESGNYPEMSKVVKTKYKHLEGMLEGSEAPDVKFENTQGASVALKEFKGKYTYIDLWATWCGPCIKEIPSLQKLEKEYHGKNIQFVSVSFDKEKDHQKWLSFIDDKKLTGNQLIAKKETNDILSKIYNIKMIPRFILLDPEGKIVDATAPFPSDPLLIELFKKHNI